MSSPVDGGLNGLVVLSFESRRGTEMAELIRRHGGTPVVAPSLREVPLAENTHALEFLAALEAGRLDMVILLTGVGTRTLAAALASRCPPERFAQLLQRATLVARGPKPVAALRELGLAATLTVPEPNTWRELLAALDRIGSLRGKRVAVQEYGVTNPELLDGLRARGATVMAVPVYRWALPQNLEPLHEALRGWAAGRADIAIFTSATQVEHVMQVAAELGVRPAIEAAAKRTVIASIGPVCNEALRRYRLQVDLEPEHPKMGYLVAAVARHGRAMLAAKGGRNAGEEGEAEPPPNPLLGKEGEPEPEP